MVTLLAHGGADTPFELLAPFGFVGTITMMILVGAAIGYRTSYDRPRGLASLRSARDRDLDQMWAAGSWDRELRPSQDAEVH